MRKALRAVSKSVPAALARFLNRIMPTVSGVLSAVFSLEGILLLWLFLFILSVISRLLHWSTFIILLLLSLVLAQVSSASSLMFAQVGAAADLREKMKEVLNIIMIFGFLYGTIRIIGGAAQMRRGEYEEGKAAIVSGALIAAAPLIMRILYEIFFNGDGSLFGK